MYLKLSNSSEINMLIKYAISRLIENLTIRWKTCSTYTAH